MFPRGGTLRNDDPQPIKQDKDYLFRPANKRANNVLKRGTPKAKKSKKISKTIAKDEGQHETEVVPKIVHSLVFNRLSIGMKMLGIVKETRSTLAMISLQNNLVGVVERSQISDEVEDAIPSEILRVGAAVRCVVVKLNNERKGGTGKRLELSLKASLVNKGLSHENVTPASVLWGSVRSIEDHGYIIGLGIAGMSGFCTFAEGLGTLEAPALCLGQPIEGVVKKVVRGKDGRRTVRSVQLDPTFGIVAKTKVEPDLVNISSLQPGMLVDAKVLRVLPTGLWVSFLKFFRGTVDLFQLDRPSFGNWADAYTTEVMVPGGGGARVRRPTSGERSARIVFVNAATKEVGLSFAHHVVKPTVSLLPTSTHAKFAQAKSVVGRVVKHAIIRRIDRKLGLLLELPEFEAVASLEAPPVHRFAFAHISRLSDDRMNSEQLVKSFKVGKSVDCRVLGESPMDGLLNVSLQPSVITATVLRYDELHPGLKVKAKIIKAESYGAVVSLGQGIKALITTMHLADVPRIKDPTQRFRPDQEIMCSVLSVDTDKRKVLLTHKKSIVRSKLPQIISYDSVKIDTVSIGFVTNIQNFGVIVTFFNNVHGLVPAATLKAEGLQDFYSAYKASHEAGTLAYESPLKHFHE